MGEPIRAGPRVGCLPVGAAVRGPGLLEAPLVRPPAARLAVVERLAVGPSEAVGAGRRVLATFGRPPVVPRRVLGTEAGGPR